MKTYLIEGKKKPNANTIVAYLVSLATVLIFVTGAVGVILQNFLWVIALVLVGLVVLANNCFNWELYKRVEFGKGEVVYKYMMPVNAMGHEEVEVIFEGGTVKTGRTWVELRGALSEKQPLRKRKSIKKCRIKNLTEKDIIKIKEVCDNV